MGNVSKLIFEGYKASEHYVDNTSEMDFSWLEDKLNFDEMDELKRQVIYHMLENEEDIFCSALNLAWSLFIELNEGKARSAELIIKVAEMLKENE